MTDPSSSSEPTLSVVVATREGWPGIRPCIESLRGQVEAVGGQLVVADGSGRPVPGTSEVGDRVEWLRRDGASVFELSHISYGAARAPIIAITEDHCTVRAGWCAGILRAHAEHPDAVAIGGAIENGSTDTALDWASYYITQGPFQAPLANGPADRIATEANLSFKRSALDSVHFEAGFGSIILFDLIALRESGAILVNDDRLVVDHFQSLPFVETSMIHFHNGRTIAAFQRRHLGGVGLIRILALPVLPAYRSWRAIRIALAKRRLRRNLVDAIPGIVWLEYCHAAGEGVGYATGAGRSPFALR